MSLSLAIFLTIFKMVVIPVQFEDRQFVTDSAAIAKNVRDAQDYFNRQFRGERCFEFDLAPVVSLKHNYSYYGHNSSTQKDVNLPKLIKDACLEAAANIDFSSYDNSGDGQVDNIMIIYAGPCEDDGAGKDMIWQQHGHLSDSEGSISIKSKHINSFSVYCELRSDKGENLRQGGIGPFCHEFAHALGLIDLYDTDYDSSGGTSEGLRDTALMDNGFNNNDGYSPPDLNAIDYELLQFGSCDTLKVGHYSLQPLIKGGQYLRYDSDNKGEYFLFESRNNGKLYIYHIDKSESQAGQSELNNTTLTASERWEYNQVNCRPDRMCAKIVAILPDGEFDSFGSETQPPFMFWSGKTSRLSICKLQTRADGSVSFDVIEPIRITNTKIHQDAAVIQWTTDKLIGEISHYEILWADGINSNSIKIGGSHDSHTIERLIPSTNYTYKIVAYASNGTYSVNDYFTTKNSRPGTIAYIYLTGVSRNKDGSFPKGVKIPLRVFNARNVAQIDWYFNDELISQEDANYLVVTQEGRLKANIQYEDGSSETIIKEIRL